MIGHGRRCDMAACRMNPTPVRHRLGRRGAFLLTGGIVWEVRND